MTLQELQKTGVDTDSITKKTNLIFLLSDIIESITTEMKEELKAKEVFKHEAKFHLSKLLFHSGSMVRMVDKTVGVDMSEHFGNESDELKDIIYRHFEIANK